MQMVTKSFVLRQDTRTRIEALEWNSDWEINFATGNYQINILNKELRKFKGNPK
jgi:flagellar biosynthesis regulator FlaF